MRGRPGPKRPAVPRSCSASTASSSRFQVLAVRRVGNQIVEADARVLVLRQRAAERDVVGVAAGRILHEQIRLGHRPRLGVHFLAEEVRLHAGHVLLRDQQHAARAAARVVHRADDALRAESAGVTGQHQIHHQVDHVARREVFTRILVERFVELPQQLLEDRPHRRVVDDVRVQIDVLEALEHLEQEARFVELADGVVEIEPLQHLAHVWAEAGDVAAEVGRDVRRIAEEASEVVLRRVVKGEAGRAPQLLIRILKPLGLQVSLLAEYLLLGRLEHAVEPPENREREDDVLILASFERVADKIGDAPDKADDFAMVQSISTLPDCRRRPN